MNENQWFPFQKSVPGSTKYLFCFHHAGGSASAFRNWIQYAGKINVASVELPGKGTRMGEDYIYDFRTLAAEIAEQIDRFSGKGEIYLYGHSMGAALAYCTGLVLSEKYHRKVEELIVSGRQAPHHPSMDQYHSSMGDDKLVEELRRLKGTPEEFLNSRELLKYILPSIKADYILNESYQYENEMADFSIKSYCGIDDDDACYDIMKHWDEVTTGNFAIQEEQGGHFFPYEMEEAFWREIESEIVQPSVISVI